MIRSNILASYRRTYTSRLNPAGNGYIEHETAASNMINFSNDLRYLLNPISGKGILKVFFKIAF
jgi:hypothetical protein